MSRSRNGRVETLRRRLEYLIQKVEEMHGESRASYFKAEIKALEWVLPIAEGHLEANRVLQEQLREEKRERDDIAEIY